MINLLANDNGFSYLDWIKQNGNPADERLLFGVVPAYPIFMFVGILLTIIASIAHFKKRGIPLREFEFAILLVVPIGVLGASIFGKVFIPGMPIWRTVFFWEPGMSLFGALFLGITVGFIIFYKRSKTTLISVWVYADCIIPNILLGQAFGRWGNLFNHEILGSVVSYDSLSWLPGFIKNKLFYFPDLSEFDLKQFWWQQVMDGSWADIPSEARTIIEKRLDFRQPLFLYEAMATLGLWFLITFGVANIGRWFSKPKPWDLEPKAYPGRFNKIYKSLPETEIISKNTIVPIKYKQVQLKTENGDTVELKLSFYKAWNKAYYWYEPSQFEITNFETSHQENSSKRYQGEQKLKKIKTEYRAKLKRISNKNKKQEEKDIYIKKRNEIFAQIGKWSRRFNINPDSPALEKLNNPNGFFVIRTGVTTGAYVFGYLLIRIILEAFRKPQELFIQNLPVLDFIMLGLLLVIGIGIIVIAQFIAPYKWREVGWLYEKSY